MVRARGDDASAEPAVVEVAGASIDLSALSRWMDGRGLGRGPVRPLGPVPGGTQNVMLRLTRSGSEYVLRRGPAHLRARSNDAVRREIEILAALSATDVPHPALVEACPDDDVLGASFYLMEPVDGFNPGAELPAPHRDDPRLRHRMGLELIDALAALARVDHHAIGLSSFGKPEGFLERQVPRWLGELESYRAIDEYRRVGPPDVEVLATWLEQHRPATWEPGILHGDFHLANALFSRGDARVAAVVDWEMATIGDPLLDLGWLLATWPDDGVAVVDGPLVDAGGLASPRELVVRYSAGSTRDLSCMPWYVVLACFKLGIVLEGTFARSLAGRAPRDTGATLHAKARALFDRAESVIAGRVPHLDAR